MSYVKTSSYKKGAWSVICDVCGFEFKSDEVRKRWDGLIVCDKDFEHDHPQKYIRARTDPKPVPFVRAEPPDVFIPICTIYNSQGIAGASVAGCAIAGKVVLGLQVF